MVESVVQSHAEIVVGSSEKKLIRVLHVDDELGLLKVAKQCLELQGPFHVDTAGSVEEALNKLKEKEYDAVVSDYQMPGKDGLEFLEMLRKNGNTIPFIMFTGKGREEVAVKAWSLGADHYVNKTGDPETVYCELAHCLRFTVGKHFTEAQMKETVQKLQTIYQNAVEGITYVDPEENIVYANKAFAGTVGYEQEQLAGMNVRRLVDDENWAKIENETKRRRQGAPSRYEVDFRRSDGTVRNALISGAPLLDHDGRFVGTIGIVLDITEQKKTKEDIKQSEERFKGIFESVDDGLVYLDAFGRIIEVNRKAVEIFGGSKEELLGKHFTKIGVLSLKEVPIFTKRFMDILRGKEAFLDVTIKNKKGQTIPLECSASISKVYGKSTIAVVARDMTERRERERLLRESEKKYRSLVEQSMQGIVIAQGPIPRIVFANSTMSKILGYTVEELTSLSPQQTAGLVHPDDRELFFGRFKDRLEGKAAPPQYEVRGIRKDGTIVWLELSSARIEYGGQRAVQAIFTDITERKKAEEAVFAERDRLETVAKSIGAGLAIISKDYRTLWANDVLKQIFGDVEGKICYSAYNQRSDICTGCGAQGVFETGKAKVVHEQVGKGADGKTVWSEITATPVKDRDGNITAVLELVVPITQRKRAEEELRDSEEKYRKLFDEAMDAIFVADAETGILVDCNRAALELVGREKSELIGKHQRILHPPEKIKRELSTTFKQHLKEKEGQILETQVVTKNGEIKNVAIKANLFELQGRRTLQGIFRDVTERKKTEQTLKESEEKYRDLVELAPDGIVAVNVEGIVTSANRSFLTLVGYDSEEEIVGKPFTELTTMRMEDIPKFQSMFKSLMKGESPSPSEFLYVRRDGTSRWAEVHPALMIKDGHPVGVQAIMRDVSERKSTERLAQESHQKFEGLFRHNPEATVYLDVNFKIVDVNPRFCQLFGYSAEEAKGRNINEVIVPESIREEAEGLDKDAKNGYASHDTVRKRKDGSLVPVSISAAPVTFENNLLGYVGIYKDITELKRAQEESEESRKHFQMLFDLMADPVAVVDGRGKVLEVTQKVEEITGFKKEELVGKNLLKVDMFGAMTKAVMIKGLAKRMIGMHVEPYEVEVLKKDGGKLLYEINAARIDYRGTPADLVVFRDIMERKNMEEKLRVVGSLTRHDVRNKLSTVTGNAYLLKRKLAGNPEALEQLVDMENAVRNVEAIFEFARTYEKLGVEQLAYVDVKKTVDEAVGLFPDLKGVKIVNECLGLTLLADSLLRQLFYNLIDDSLKYGEKLTQIRIRYEKSEDQLKLVYEDDGVGISKDNKAKLFTEGFTTGKGSGYGLYLIGRMMDVYDWTISETGTHGKGAQFTINMPEAKPDGRQNYKLS